MVNLLNRTFRVLRNRVRRAAGWHEWTGAERPASYYDTRFTECADFNIPFYKCPYYATWLVIIDRLRRYRCESILDVGCGPGQFAALCDDWCFESYTGLDFSGVAIEMARKTIPRFDFRQADVRHKTAYDGLQFDAIVCTEVLEHIRDDAAVLSCFPAGTRCLMTVPNYPWKSHVRHFTSRQAATDRYADFFEEFSVVRIKGTRGSDDQLYLMDGIRNSVARYENPSTEADQKTSAQTVDSPG